MKGKALLLSALLSVVFLVVWLLPIAEAGAGDTTTALETYTAVELPLNDQGTAFEVNADDAGGVWVSDIDAEEIWHVRASGHYTIYGSIASPSDAHRDDQGNVWWGQWKGNRLGRLSPSTGQVRTWIIPGAASLLGVQIDAAGHVWVSESSGPYLYRFEPGTGQLCTYTIPDEGAAEYLAVQEQELWFGDWKNDRIFRLQSQSDTATYWSLSVDSFPEGVALDAGGNFWWADPGVEGVARLEPTADRVTRFQRPISGTAQMLAVAGETVWYSDDQLPGTVTRMEAASAGGDSVTVTQQDAAMVPSCTALGPGSSATASISSDIAAWQQQTLDTLYSSAAWDVLKLPAGSSPWGVAIVDGAVWVVEPTRHVLILIRAQAEWSVYLPNVVR